MTLTPFQTIIIILVIAFGTILTRATPFILFPEKKEPPKIINYLSKMLPAAMMGLLVIYCFKSTPIITYPYFIPELICVALITILQLWRKNVLLSIGAGTILYMILVQFVFV